MTFLRLLLLRAAVLLALLIVTRYAAAERIVVHTEGPNGEAVKSAVERALPASWTMGDSARFTKALRSSGPVPPVASVVGKRDATRAIERVQAAAIASGHRAVILARTTKTRKGSSVTLGLVDSNGAPQLTKQGPVVMEKLDDAASELLASLPASAKAVEPANGSPTAAPSTSPNSSSPDAHASTDATTRSTPERPSSPPPSFAARGALLDVSVGIGLRSRHFQYNDALTSNTRSYDVDAVPYPEVHVAVFPFASKRGIGGLGVIGDAGIATGLSSRTADGVESSTRWTRFDVGLRYRLPLGSSPRAVVLGASGTYGRETFAFTSRTVLDDELPSVDYSFLRPALDVEAPLFGPITLRAQAAYLAVLAAGDIRSRIRGANTVGVEASAGVGCNLSSAFELRASATWTRFAYAFAPLPGDRYIAGGALDEMLGMHLALAFRLDGSRS